MNDPSHDPREALIRQRAKAMMRKRFRGHRQALPTKAAAARATTLCQRLLEHPQLQHAHHIALFWPLERYREVGLRPLDAALRQRGCSLSYPRIDPNDGSMQFLQVPDLAQLVDGPMGLREPPASATVVKQLDVVIVPGIAFDADGYRIGYGGGFYDRTLPRYCPPAVSIGVAYEVQLAAEVPRETHDVAVDQVMTERRTLDVA